MGRIRAVPLRQIRHVNAAFHRALLVVSERVYIWPIAQKRRSSSLKGIPTLLLLISSYSFGRNGANPTLCHSQRGGLGLWIVFDTFPSGSTIVPAPLLASHSSPLQVSPSYGPLPEKAPKIGRASFPLILLNGLRHLLELAPAVWRVLEAVLFQ
jgi:hypothetical protein